MASDLIVLVASTLNRDIEESVTECEKEDFYISESSFEVHTDWRMDQVDSDAILLDEAARNGFLNGQYQPQQPQQQSESSSEHADISRNDSGSLVCKNTTSSANDSNIDPGTLTITFA